jgi:peptide deformylase
MRKIIKYPHIALTQPTKKVKEIDDELIILLDEMHEIIKKEDAIGIAANQLGVLKRVCVVELDEETGLFEMINPEIVKHSGKSIDIEGCLSFPDIYGTVERYEEVTIRYVDRDGYEMEVDATDYLARAFQHEIEHLDGKVLQIKLLKQLPQKI